MSEGLWRTRFDADPGIIGREIRLDGTLWKVIGRHPNR
jgi:hypothetical protein